MAKHYPDRFDRGEDFSESPDIPDEFKVCACCERCDVDMVDMEPFMVLTSYGDTIESRYCYGRPSDAPDPLRTLVELETPACGHFKPTAEALADAAAEAEHCRDPYASHGMNEGRDFY